MQFDQRRGLSLAYDFRLPPARGDGLARNEWVVLLHGLGMDHRVWARQQAALAGSEPGYPSLVPDLRGHGRSAAPGGAYRLDDLADDVVAVMDAANVRRATVVGLDLGGMIGLVLARRYPSRVRRLLLAGTVPAYPPEALMTWKERIALARRAGLAPLVETTLEHWFTPQFRVEHPEEVAQARSWLVATPTAGYVGASCAMADAELFLGATALSCPTLALVGNLDQVPLPAEVSAWADGQPGASADCVPGAAHLLTLEQSDVFNRILLRFLATP